MTMILKNSKSISKLNLRSNQMITTDQCINIKGKGKHYCCIRNRWIHT